MRAPFALALVLAFAPGCGRKATHAECTEMLDRYLGMQIARGPEMASLPAGQAPALIELRKAEKKATSGYLEKQAQCEKEVSRREYDCAMATTDPNIWEACID
ncbi:MAG: hypothetical protein ABIP39_08935 [Polyangiaceae bacterium]